MKYKLLSFLLLLSSFTFNSKAQIKEDISHFFKMGGKIISAPANFDSEDILNLSLVGGVTAASFFWDNTGRAWALNNRSDFKDKLFSIDKSSTIIIGASAIGIYGYGLASENSKIRRLGLQLAEAGVYATGITYIIKIISGRSRPFTNRGHKDFNPVQTKEDKTAFPSGHTTLAFAFSNVMAKQIDNVFWKIGWYGAATAVSIGRVYNDKHWVSDIVLGAAIGYFVSNFVLNNHVDKNKVVVGEKTKRPAYFPSIKYFNNQPIYSLNFTYSF